MGSRSLPLKGFTKPVYTWCNTCIARRRQPPPASSLTDTCLLHSVFLERFSEWFHRPNSSKSNVKCRRPVLRCDSDWARLKSTEQLKEIDAPHKCKPLEMFFFFLFLVFILPVDGVISDLKPILCNAGSLCLESCWIIQLKPYVAPALHTLINH